MNMTFKAKLKENSNGYYGIIIYRNDGRVKRFEEITQNLCALENLVHKINEGDVSELHVYDILEDIIG